MIGQTIRDYRIVTELGGGGMGTVYFAEHTVIGRRAAIKILNREVSSSEDIVGRFFTEARAVNAIRHPNIVDITDFGRREDCYFIIMEMLEGETLGARLERETPLPPATAVRILSQVASAVGAVNERGIVHRDLKPENIFITNHPDYPDFVKVLDFGVVKLMGEPATRDAHRTQPGTAIGTPAYMSPEQCLGDAKLDHRSDIYSLGVVAYEMLVGSPPFDGDVLEQMVAHAKMLPPNPKERNPALPDALGAVLLRALAKRPEDRYPSMRELRVAFEDAVSGRAAPDRSPVPAAPPTPASPEPAAAAPPPPSEPTPARQAATELVAPADPAAVTLPAATPPDESPPPRATALAVAPGRALLPPVIPRHAFMPPPASLFERPASPPQKERIERIERAQTKSVGSKLREIIAGRIASNRLQVPAMPVVAVKCLQIMTDENARFSEIAATLEKDPLVASRLLRIANSPAYGGRETISSMERAVTRLGLKPLRLILLEVAAREVFASRSTRIRELFRAIWEHCLAVATLARELAGALPGTPERDGVYLAGLFHDIGKPVVAALLLEAERSLMEELDAPFMTDSLWLKVVQDAHRDVGGVLATSWLLPESVAQVIRDLGAYEKELGRRSPLNIVRFANGLTKRERLYETDIDAEEVVQVVAEGRDVLGVDEQLEARLVEGLKERISSMTNATSSSSSSAVQG